MFRLSSTEKPLLILKRLGDPPYGLSLSELSECIGIGKSGTYKVLQTMKEHHFVVQDDFTKKYYLGPPLLRLGNVYSKCAGIEDIIKPVLVKLSRQIGATAYVSVWEGDRVFGAYLDAPPGGVYSSNDFIGKSIAVNAGASAMLLCAYQDPVYVEKNFDAFTIEKRTPGTLTDKAEVLAEFARIRERGHVIEDETFNPGEVSVAVPLFDKNKRVLASLACAGYKKDVDEGTIENWLHLLKREANEILSDFQFRH